MHYTLILERWKKNCHWICEKCDNLVQMLNIFVKANIKFYMTFVDEFISENFLMCAAWVGLSDLSVKFRWTNLSVRRNIFFIIFSCFPFHNYGSSSPDVTFGGDFFFSMTFCLPFLSFSFFCLSLSYPIWSSYPQKRTSKSQQ